MQVSLTATGGLERRLEVAIPAAQVDGEVAQRLNRISRTARLKGFRPGKAPLAVIRQQYGDQVHGEVMNDLMRARSPRRWRARSSIPPAVRASSPSQWARAPISSTPRFSRCCPR